jgi:hypothetical protein
MDCRRIKESGAKKHDMSNPQLKKCKPQTNRVRKINDVCGVLCISFWRGAVWVGTEEEATISVSFSVTGYFGPIKYGFLSA